MQEDGCNGEHLQINSSHQKLVGVYISSRWGGLGGQFWSPWLPEGGQKFSVGAGAVSVIFPVSCQVLDSKMRWRQV